MKKAILFVFAFAMVIGLFSSSAMAAEPIKVPIATVTLAGNPTPETGSLPDVATIKNTLDTSPNFILSLTDETFALPASGDIIASFKSIAAYSIDGGTKWKSGTPGTKEIAALFNKGGTLVVTDKFDSKTKAPSKGTSYKAATSTADAVDYDAPGIVVKFSAIVARPPAPKLAVNYSLSKDDTGKTNGAWTVTEKGKTIEYAAAANGSLLICAPAGKKITDDDVWQNWSNFEVKDEDKNTIDTYVSDKGIAVKSVPDGSKPFKSTYFLRLPESITGDKYTPASKTAKVSVSSLIKAPNLKVDYKKEQIKLKAPINVFFGATLPEGDIDLIAKTSNGWIAKSNELIVIPADKKDDAKVPAIVSAIITEAGTAAGAENKVLVWTGASDKKPASLKQTIVLAPRAAAPTDEITASKGKASMDKTLEAYDTSKSKWGGFPKFEKVGISNVDIRVKSTAKQLKDGSYENNAASLATTYDVKVDDYTGNEDKAKQKNGVVEVKPKGSISSTVAAVGTATVVEGTKVVTVKLTAGKFAGQAAVETTSNWTIGGTDAAALGTITDITRVSDTEVTIEVANNAVASKAYTITANQAAFEAATTTPFTTALTVTISSAPIVAAVGTATVVEETKVITVELTAGNFADKAAVETVANWTIGGTDAAALGTITDITRVSDTEVTITVTNDAVAEETYTITANQAAFEAATTTPFAAALTVEVTTAG